MTTTTPTPTTVVLSYANCTTGKFISQQHICASEIIIIIIKYISGSSKELFFQTKMAAKQASKQGMAHQ